MSSWSEDIEVLEPTLLEDSMESGDDGSQAEQTPNPVQLENERPTPSNITVGDRSFTINKATDPLKRYLQTAENLSSSDAGPRQPHLVSSSKTSSLLSDASSKESDKTTAHAESSTKKWFERPEYVQKLSHLKWADRRTVRLYRGQLSNEQTNKDFADYDPSIVWAAKVFDTRSNKTAHIDRPNVTYVDERPFNFPVCDSQKGSTSARVRPTGDDDRTEERAKAEWFGPAIRIEIHVKAEFPKLAYSQSMFVKRDGTVQHGDNLETAPEIVPKIEALKLNEISASRIIVISPYILLNLARMIQYYPSFYEKYSAYRMKRESADTRILKEFIFALDEPFAVLLHHFSLIENFVGDDDNGTTEHKVIDGGNDSNRKKMPLSLTMEHMKTLYAFLKPLYDASMPTCEKYLSEPSPRLAFDMVWYLFKPGTDVYIRGDGITYVAVVVDVKSGHPGDQGIWHDTAGQKWWQITMWRLETDGSSVGRVLAYCRIDAYLGLREVTGLPACPVSIWDTYDNGERRRNILSRSKILFKALRQGNLLAHYNGPVKENNQSYSGKVVIDCRRGLANAQSRPQPLLQVIDHSENFKDYDKIFVKEYQHLQAAPMSQAPDDTIFRKKLSGNTSTRAIYGNAKVDSWLTTSSAIDQYSKADGYEGDPSEHIQQPVVEDLTEHQLLLLYPETRAFGLKTKQWMVIWVDYVEEISPCTESISNLIIGEDELMTIRALSNRQNSKKEQWSADFIEGKGSGQIILLHGPPGVGKTYTVEAISEWLHRPLLALTVADIGTVETLIEGELVKWFDLAEAWNAVLLVDEADIFLEKRQNRDLSRNGLVSAFLRRMEYFNGLLFLTTNRVGQIDDAFVSRIHVAIGYPTLDAETRKKIWNGFFLKLIRERAGKVQIAPDAKKWVLDTTSKGQAELNGRDIRNALQTAITLAEFECEEDPDYNPSLAIVVSKEHFQKVLEMSNKFHSYVTSIRREDERRRASGRGDRNDYGYGYDAESSSELSEILKCKLKDKNVN